MSSDKQSVRVGGIDYPTHSHAIGTDERRHLEVTGKIDPDHNYRKVLLIEQFGDTRINELPRNLYIQIDYPNTPLGIFENFEIANQYGKGIIHFTLFYSYTTWNNPKHLWHFIKELSGKILAEIADITSAEVEQDEGCAWISVRAKALSSSAIREYIVTLERQITELSNQVNKLSGPVQLDEPSQPQLKPDEKGFKWWLRYVIVPVIGSAALIAILRLVAGQA